MTRLKLALFVVTALTLGTGAATAEARLDPMAALAGRAAGMTPGDPMSALRAQDDADADTTGNPEFGGLPDGLGAEDTYYQCVACHSTEIIKQQRVSDQRWDEIWTWMVETQGMVEPEPETKALILGYLKQNFSAR